MWYRESLRIVRIRHALRQLDGAMPPEEVERLIEELRRAVARSPEANQELSRELDRWRVRFEALGLCAP